ncbi:hypothetical protein Pmani_033067 [Petrolisthes manimaculis]|uniref:Uncharacterized protein n=1 Tax=Petrolisthes manimaculis TaxID=1843537 RepID=A0AAE1TT40_9EUCA|nr:hypothetical protein Pmani_033067 [Petrolisthes manimaculis]
MSNEPYHSSSTTTTNTNNNNNTNTNTTTTNTISAQTPTVYADRLRMVWLWLRGRSPRQISHETGASLCTVYRWVKRWQEEGNVETRPHRSRTRTTTSSVPTPSSHHDTLHHTQWLFHPHHSHPHVAPWTSATHVVVPPPSYPYIVSLYDSYVVTAALNSNNNDYILYKLPK